MWFGTGSGLNRYDGRTFKVFRMPGISYRRIDRVVSLDTDYLLLRSEQNLFLFDKKYERFLPVCDSVSKQPVMFADFVADSDGSCWGVSSGELSEVNFPSSFVQDTAFVSVRHVVNNSQSVRLWCCVWEKTGRCCIVQAGMELSIVLRPDKGS